MELGTIKVRVNVIVPGYIETDMTEGMLFLSSTITEPSVELFQSPVSYTTIYSNVQMLSYVS